MTRLYALLAVATIGLAACGGTDESGVPTNMEKVLGDGQDVTVNSRAQQPLRVRLRTIVGDPTPGIAVQWTVISGSATLDDDRTSTNEDGIAENGVTVGSQVAPVRIQASVPGVAVDPQVFQLDVVHDEDEDGEGGGGGQQSVGTASGSRP